MKSEEFSKRYSLYFVLGSVLLIIIFVWALASWVKNDSDSKTVEENLKADLFKNPVNSIPISSNQNASANQNQANQAAQNAAQTNDSQSESLNSAINTDNMNTDVGATAPENSGTKKFESTNLKASFDYPKDVSVSESDKLITLTKSGISWKIRFYDNKNKKEFQSWYTSHFDIEVESDCSFTEGTVKVGNYTSKSVKASSDSVKCEGDGNYAINTSKSRVVKIELGKETVENVNKILASFKFTE